MNVTALAVVFAPNIIENFRKEDVELIITLINISSELAQEMEYKFPEFKDYGVEHYENYSASQEIENDSVQSYH